MIDIVCEKMQFTVTMQYMQNLELGDESSKISTVLTRKKGKKLEKSQTTLERKIEIDYVSYLNNLGK